MCVAVSNVKSGGSWEEPLREQGNRQRVAMNITNDMLLMGTSPIRRLVLICLVSSAGREDFGTTIFGQDLGHLSIERVPVVTFSLEFPHSKIFSSPKAFKNIGKISEKFWEQGGEASSAIFVMRVLMARLSMWSDTLPE